MRSGRSPILAHVSEAEPPRGPGRPRKRLAWSTAVFATITGASRVLGLLREILVRRAFGVEGEINAFTVAFQVPNLVRALAADAALGAAFVPVFSELLEREQRERAWRVASTLFWLVLLVLGAVTGLLMLVAPLIMRIFGLGDLEELATVLSRILFPIVVLTGVSGIVVGILNSYEEFTVQALMPVIWNAVIIATLLVVVPRFESEEAQLYAYATGVLAGTLVQTITPVWWLKGRDGRIRAVLDLRDPAVKRVLVLMLPVTLALGLINFSFVVNTFFASRFVDPQLAPSAIDAAFRIYMLPQGLFAVAVATVLFPRLSRLAARGELTEFRDWISLGLRQIGFLLVPASAVAAVLAEPIVRVLYQRGEFTADQTPVVAAALAAFALGLTFNGAMLLLNRSFFSLQSPWTPTAVALGALALNAILAAVLYQVGVWGIPLATSLANVAGTLALLAVLRRRLGRLDGTAIASSYARIGLASTFAAATAFGAWYGLDATLGRSLGAQVVSVGAAILAAASVYLASAALLRVRELRALLSLRRGSATTDGERP